MRYDDEKFNRKSSPLKANLGRIAALLGLIVVGVLIFQYRDAFSSRISQVFEPGDEEPIPVAKLVKQKFSLTVPSTGEIVGLETTPVTTPSTASGAMTIAWLVPEGSFVKEGDPVIRFDSTDAKLNLEKQQNTLNANQENTKIKTWSQDTDAEVLKMDRTDAELEYEYAMTVMPQDESIFSKWDIITAEADAHYAKERIDFLKSKGKTQKRIARSDQQILAIERNKAQSEIAVIEQTLNSMELKAPVSGLVLYRRDHREDPQVGDQSFPGQVLVEVINLDVLQARIYVLERDGGSLVKDQTVSIHLDAIPEKAYHGVIRTVSSVAASIERNSPLRYFTCDVDISDAGKDLKRIRPGMNLRGDVVLQQYDSCFVVPSGAVTYKEKTKENVVYIKKGDKFETKPVETGLSSHGEAVILGGVQEGELIALNNPDGTRQLYLPDFSKGGSQNEFNMPGGPGGPPPMMRMMMGRGGRR